MELEMKFKNLTEDSMLKYFVFSVHAILYFLELI
jgi:hypothetical protein